MNAFSRKELSSKLFFTLSAVLLAGAVFAQQAAALLIEFNQLVNQRNRAVAAHFKALLYRVRVLP